jgi:trehalose/maltose hydrolase-like predicted phosphorylase
VSFEKKHLMAITYSITPLNFSGTIQIRAALDGNVMNLTTENDPRTGSGLHGRVLLIEDRFADGSTAAIVQHTQNTAFKLAVAIDTRLTTASAHTLENDIDEFTVNAVYNVAAEQGTPITLDKFVAYVTSLDGGDTRLLERAREIALAGKTETFAALQAAQERFMADYWSRTDVEVRGDMAIQQGIRFNSYHLLQSVGRDGRTNIAAKGLTGEGYEGHYFWDTETYVVPFFLYNNPEIARKLLEYRYSILDKARERARQMAHPKGALFPWRTINGEESSAYFPAGTAQYHINADVACAIRKYMKATDDTEFLVNYGAEILFETARVWADLGDFIPRKGNKFCINGVTGPDEYTALVDNNCYTNMMAQVNLAYAYEMAQWMRANSPQDFAKIAAKIGLEAPELDFWKRAADNMYIPYDEESGLYMQDDSFLDKAVWDFANTPSENYPLLIHYHPLVIYRYQVCKQADLVLALFLQGDKFTLDDKKRNYDYYEKITTHDSSLSTCIFSIVASEIGYHDKAYQYFIGTARMDLDDYHGNVKDGIHVANMAGTWMSLVNGFASMRVYNETLSFDPYLPQSWEGYSFKISFRGCLLKVSVDKALTTYDLIAGDGLAITHHGDTITLTRGEQESARVATSQVLGV